MCCSKPISKDFINRQCDKGAQSRVKLKWKQLKEFLCTVVSMVALSIFCYKQRVLPVAAKDLFVYSL